jgi:addiction module HigA family antidote
MASHHETRGIGTFIRTRILPAEMTVKEAAARLGVGRPALSNLLNGRSTLSPEMAQRLAKAFGANERELLEMQSSASRAERKTKPATTRVRTYVPSFLAIKARQIEAWAETQIEARQHLAVLLRRLIRSTSDDIGRLDFPGFDNAERQGPDGEVSSASETPWIPAGLSFWEFGTDKRPSSKAESDYQARTRAIPASKRQQATFVFVTPRNWSGKSEWASKKAALGEWGSVRAFDASDLEQWLEDSIPGQMWLAERLSLQTSGFRTLGECWEQWASASDPPLTKELFAPSVQKYGPHFKRWLEQPPGAPFVIAADSSEEGLAFLHWLLESPGVPARTRDLAVAFHSPDPLRKLVPSSSTFLPIAANEDVERELAPIYRRVHSIVIRTRNTVDTEPDITLELLSDAAFEHALTAMGIPRLEHDRLAAESGRSPTILRRRLSRIDAIKTPRWARESATSRALIPMALAGAWHAKSSADREILSVLADRPYPQLEQELARLLTYEDSPVWSIEQHRGVASKIDAIFAIAPEITGKDLTDFLMLAELVLSESDPALALPESDRWAANLHGKVRDHSAALRAGVCETLVILTVHGDRLFRERLGLRCADEISALVRRLLTPFTLERLMSHERDLPRYAEAAPEELLRILEADLKQAQPVIFGLLTPASSGIFGHCARTGLLWALECLAWKPERLMRTAVILAQLSSIKIEDNWANKPLASLEAILSAWLPQTAATLDQRTSALETITKRFPRVGWQLALQQFAPGRHVGQYNWRPKWRTDASGAGQMVPGTERVAFTRRALDVALAWPTHDHETLGDLVEHIEGIPGPESERVWRLVVQWSQENASDEAKASLRERIRRFALTRRGRIRLKDGVRQDARKASRALEPKDPVLRHNWLFAKHWVEESADEAGDEQLDYAKRQERLDKLRIEAIREVWEQSAFDGILRLLERTEAPHVVGAYAREVVQDFDEFITSCLATEGGTAASVDACLQGFLADGARKHGSQLEATVASLRSDPQRRLRLLWCAPFEEQTWSLVEAQGPEVRTAYWQQVNPSRGRHSEAAASELVDRLLDVHRPRAAFNTVHLEWEKVETSRLHRLLVACATDPSDLGTQFKLDPYDISAALQVLQDRAGITDADMAQLEFLFLEALDCSDHGIPNLERQVTRSPGLFVHAVALAYKRQGPGADPEEWQVDDPVKRNAVAMGAHRLLNQLSRIPGTDDDGHVNSQELASWLEEARELSAQHGRSEMADYCIGELLSKAPADGDGVWPCRTICEAMEAISSEPLAEGFSIGVQNARGATWRSEGGSQERELAIKYQAWSQQLAFEFPFVSRILGGIASSYIREAEWHDSDDRIRRRLRS